jgi:hypothetical protein
MGRLIDANGFFKTFILLNIITICMVALAAGEILRLKALTVAYTDSMYMAMNRLEAKLPDVRAEIEADSDVLYILQDLLDDTRVTYPAYGYTVINQLTLVQGRLADLIERLKQAEEQ